MDKLGQSVESANRLTGGRGLPASSASKSISNQSFCMPTPPAWPQRPQRQRPWRLGDLPVGIAGGQISIEQALIAAGVNLLLPFSPAFCFAVIVCLSLEYKILWLAGGPPSCSGCQPAVSILYQPAGLCWKPWPGLDFLFLLDQAKRRGFIFGVKPCSFEEGCFLRIDSVTRHADHADHVCHDDHDDHVRHAHYEKKRIFGLNSRLKEAAVGSSLRDLFHRRPDHFRICSSRFIPCRSAAAGVLLSLRSADAFVVGFQRGYHVALADANDSHSALPLQRQRTTRAAGPELVRLRCALVRCSGGEVGSGGSAGGELLQLVGL